MTLFLDDFLFSPGLPIFFWCLEIIFHFSNSLDINLIVLLLKSIQEYYGSAEKYKWCNLPKRISLCKVCCSIPSDLMANKKMKYLFMTNWIRINYKKVARSIQSTLSCLILTRVPSLSEIIEILITIYSPYFLASIGNGTYIYISSTVKNSNVVIIWGYGLFVSSMFFNSMKTDISHKSLKLMKAHFFFQKVWCDYIVVVFNVLLFLPQLE